jgi:hypothetical protein
LTLLADAVKAKDYETARYFVDDERIAGTASKSFLDAAMTPVKGGFAHKTVGASTDTPTGIRPQDCQM